MVGQLARTADASLVVGTAGTADKCAWLVDELGFDVAINYRTQDVAGHLREACPHGIDVFFDNVGGDTLDAGLANLAMHARVVLCGAISQYNEDRPVGPRNYLNLIVKRSRMEGFLILDYLDRFPEAQLKMAGWVMGGQIKHREHVVEGLDPADAPTILATSGGLRRGPGGQPELAPLIHHAFELAGVSGRAPSLCHLGTAMGDQLWWNAMLSEAGRASGVTVHHLNLFTMPNVEDIAGFLLEHDTVWVGGGSVANLLAVWRVHGLDRIFRQVWAAGVVLGGVSAGSLCWHVGGTTDSFGPQLRPVTDGLGFLPYANGVHYDSEPQRRPLLQRLVADGTLPDAYATDDGVGLVYRGTELVEAVTEVAGRGAYRISREGEGAVEERIEPRVLPGAA